MVTAMQTRRVSLFRNGRNQAIRIPRGFEIPGTEAILRKDGDRLVIEPADPLDLLGWLKTLEPIEDSIGAIEDLAIDEVKL
jgi:antitoxin VapB